MPLAVQTALKSNNNGVANVALSHRPACTISGGTSLGDNIEPVHAAFRTTHASSLSSKQEISNLDERSCVDALLSLTHEGDDELEKWVVDNEMDSDEEIIFEDSVGDKAVLEDPSFEQYRIVKSN